MLSCSEGKCEFSHALDTGVKEQRLAESGVVSPGNGVSLPRPPHSVRFPPGVAGQRPRPSVRPFVAALSPSSTAVLALAAAAASGGGSSWPGPGRRPRRGRGADTPALGAPLSHRPDCGGQNRLSPLSVRAGARCRRRFALGSRCALAASGGEAARRGATRAGGASPQLSEFYLPKEKGGVNN